MKRYQYQVYENGNPIAVMTARQIMQEFGLNGASEYAKRGLVYAGKYTLDCLNKVDNTDNKDRDTGVFALEWDYWRKKILRIQNRKITR